MVNDEIIIQKRKIGDLDETECKKLLDLAPSIYNGKDSFVINQEIITRYYNVLIAKYPIREVYLKLNFIDMLRIFKSQEEVPMSDELLKILFNASNKQMNIYGFRQILKFILTKKIKITEEQFLENDGLYPYADLVLRTNKKLKDSEQINLIRELNGGDEKAIADQLAASKYSSQVNLFPLVSDQALLSNFGSFNIDKIVEKFDGVFGRLCKIFPDRRKESGYYDLYNILKNENYIRRNQQEFIDNIETAVSIMGIAFIEYIRNRDLKDYFVTEILKNFIKLVQELIPVELIPKVESYIAQYFCLTNFSVSDMLSGINVVDYIFTKCSDNLFC